MKTKKSLTNEELMALDKAIYSESHIRNVDRNTHYLDYKSILFEGHYCFITVNPILPVTKEEKPRFPKIIKWDYEHGLIVGELLFDSSSEGINMNCSYEILQTQISGKGIFALCRIYSRLFTPSVFGDVINTQFIVFNHVVQKVTGVSKVYLFDNQHRKGLTLDGKLYVNKLSSNRHLVRYAMRERSTNLMYYFNKPVEERFQKLPSLHIPSSIIACRPSENKLLILYESGYNYFCSSLVVGKRYLSTIWTEEMSLYIENQEFKKTERLDITFELFFKVYNSLIQPFGLK